MNRLLVDTSAYSAFKRGHAGVTGRLSRADEIVLTPIVLGELYAGFQRGDRREKNKGELELFISSPRVMILPIDEQTAERYALILESLRSAGSPIPTNDLWIAASAMQHGLAVLTTDDHFRRVQQVVVEHFAP